MKNDSKIIDRANNEIKELRKEFYDLFINNPISTNEVLTNLGLFIRSQSLKRILFMHMLYQLQLNIHGSIFEFGVRWGQNLALFACFRDIYEPFNTRRRIIGFDTFKGFPSVSQLDGKDNLVYEGSFSAASGYEKYLEKILTYHEKESPVPEIKRFELVKGDATKELLLYLEKNPETIVSLAYFDFDIYEPTKKCLELIKPHCVKGTVIGFDELNLHEFPGETIAFNEVLGLNNFKLLRTPFSGTQSYIIFE